MLKQKKISQNAYQKFEIEKVIWPECRVNHILISEQMLLILETSMLIGWIDAVIAARISAYLFGGGKYQVEGRSTRFLGIILMLP